LYSFDLGLILRVIISPNSAFSQIRDNQEKYFAQSIGLLIFSSILGILIVLPFVMMPLDDAYFEYIDDTGNMNSIPSGETDVIWFVGLSILNGFISTALFYFIGKKLGGEANWKKVFSVVFHTNAIAIPMIIILSILIFFMWGSLTSIEPTYLLEPDVNDEEIWSSLVPFLGYIALVAIMGIGFFVWLFVILVKAVKIVHGFETGKAFGLVVLVMIITTIVTIPLSY
jgi:hypothetical protein